MIIKCKFCDFKRETPLSTSILNILTTEEMPTEDFILWFQRLLTEHGTHDWNAVKIHMGRMHKADTYYGIWPESAFSPDEEPQMNNIAELFEEHHNLNALMNTDTLTKHQKLPSQEKGIDRL